MIKKLVVLAILTFFALPIKAEESDLEFVPMGATPSVSLSKNSSEARPLPMLTFFDVITPIDVDDSSSSFNIKSNLFYDDTPVNEVYLDDDVKRPCIVLPTNLFNSPIVTNQNSNAITGRSVFARNVYVGESSRSVAGIKGYSTETTGNFSFGAGYSRGLDKAQMEDNASLFTRYDAGRFALNSQYTASSKQHLGTQANSFKLSPEVKINDQFKIRTGFQSYTNIPLKKGEVVLVYSPSVRKYLESLNFELGVAQRYNTATGIRGSEVRFSTGFKL